MVMSRAWKSQSPAPYLIAVFALAIAGGFGMFAWLQQQEIGSLKNQLAETEKAYAESKESVQKLTIAAREVAESNVVRGRMVLRDESGQRIAMPALEVRLFPKKAIQEHLDERHASAVQQGLTDPARLTTHYLKDLPRPLDVTSTDSHGRFELKVPEPGDYVIQTHLYSKKTGGTRIWFVSFDSREPLNTPVDISESNWVRDFNPLLMIFEGR